MAAAGFSDYNLHQPCCNGDSLLGEHASIRTPSVRSTFTDQGCMLQRTAAQAVDSPGLIQAGFASCEAHSNIRGECATSNKQVQFVEIIDEAGLGHCYSHGAIGESVDAKYGVTNTSGGSTWGAYIDGIEDTHTVSFALQIADRLIEGAEWTGANCPGQFNSGSTTFGASTVWQRLNGSSWVTVQSAYIGGNGCGFSISGGPSGQWTISH